jgi:hypothetical protein
LKPVSLTVGYTNNHTGNDFRIFHVDERKTCSATPPTWWARHGSSFRGQYEFGDRGGSELDQDLLVEIGEHPEMPTTTSPNRTPESA